MLFALTLAALLGAPPAASAGDAASSPCARRPLNDLQLAAEAHTAFAGRLVVADTRRRRATYRVTHALVGPVRRGQRVTITHCGELPEAAEHIVFVDRRRVALNGAGGVEPSRPARLAALEAFGATQTDQARADALVALYREFKDRRALTALVDAPALLALLDDAARDALIGHIGRTPWTEAEVSALARLRRPTAIGLLTLAQARCEQGGFDTPCHRAIPRALDLARRPDPPDDRAALAECLRSCPDRLGRLLALDRCEQLRREAFDGGFAHPTFSARLAGDEVDGRPFAPEGGGADSDAAWARAAAWCEAAGEPPPRPRPTSEHRRTR